MMQGLSYVERYAWYSLIPNQKTLSLANSDGSLNVIGQAWAGAAGSAGATINLVPKQPCAAPNYFCTRLMVAPALPHPPRLAMTLSEPSEGYPPLWFFLQAPLAKLGLPFASLGVLNALCATLAVAVMVWFSPFALWQKALIAFSYSLFCYYGMVWRCYSLLILALFLVAACYPTRHQQPLRYALCVVLLANVHVLSLGVALLFLLGFIVGLIRRRSAWSREVAPARRKAVGSPAAQVQPKKGVQPGALNASAAISLPMNLLAGLIMAAAVTLLVLQLRQPPDCRWPGLFPLFNPTAPLSFLASAFDWLRNLPQGLFCFCSLAVFVLLLWDLRQARDAFWLLLLTFLGWCYVFTFKNVGPAPWHGASC